VFPEGTLKQFDDDQPVALSISDLAAWRRKTVGCRLHLPPIQRSVVWSNEQVINYWDSLLRGYPPGMMMVHRAGGTKGVDAEGHTRDSNQDDYQLFDGQQRMAAVLLGMGEGQLTNSRQIWVDLGVAPKPNSGLRFQLRITTPGQPFGYRPEAPNQKIELDKRRQRWDEWLSGKQGSREDAFRRVTGDQLIDSRCAIPLAEICVLLQQTGQDGCIADLSQRQGAVERLVADFIPALDRALRSKVILQRVAAEIVGDQDEYIRFFVRLGQGGTRLSDDELTYSIIKHQYPDIRDRMEAILGGSAGRLAGEVDLVLATLRVAKTCAPWAGAKEWEIIARPSPEFVSRLHSDESRAPVLTLFRSLILNADSRDSLQEHLERIRKALAYHSKDHPSGIPPVLLARLPRELVDVLILFGVKRGAEPPWRKDESALLTSFALYWLLFVSDDAKAAWQAYLQVKEDEWRLSVQTIRFLIHDLEENGIAHYVPRLEQFPALRAGVERALTCPHIRTWNERFTEIDAGEEHKPGEALRVLSTKEELIKRALMWLQRSYIAGAFDYDPTSGRDEDLPVDLDHIVPNSVFGFDWRSREARLGADVLSNALVLENFRWQRSFVGNSLGNFRWVDASSNRRRGNRSYVPLDTEGDDFVDNPEDWNSLIPDDAKRPWGECEIGKFQYLVDLRTLDLYKRLILEGGLSPLVEVIAPSP
jgi:hypothetical protein